MWFLVARECYNYTGNGEGGGGEECQEEEITRERAPGTIPMLRGAALTPCFNDLPVRYIVNFNSILDPL